MQFTVKNNNNCLIVNCAGRAVWVKDIEEPIEILFYDLELEKTAAAKLILNFTDRRFVRNNTSKSMEIIINSLNQKIEMANKQREEKIKLVVACNDDRKNQAFKRLGLKEIISFTGNLSDALNL